MKVHALSFKSLITIGVICMIASLAIMGVFHLLFGLPFLFLGLIWITLAIETKGRKKIDIWTGRTLTVNQILYLPNVSWTQHLMIPNPTNSFTSLYIINNGSIYNLEFTKSQHLKKNLWRGSESSILKSHKYFLTY